VERLVSYCGYRCDRCPAYKENIQGPEDRQLICAALRGKPDAMKPIAEKHAHSTPPGNYARYIPPYESVERLRKIADELGTPPEPGARTQES
jgi:hypothetical protein